MQLTQKKRNKINFPKPKAEMALGPNPKKLSWLFLLTRFFNFSFVLSFKLHLNFVFNTYRPTIIYNTW